MKNIEIGITAANRESVTYLLNVLFADEHILYVKTRNDHWNVRCLHFQSLHKFFKSQYEELAELIDNIAEEVLSLGR